ncbi:MAG: hypothetical protein MZV70_15730 [Desulfobacterales bacterium]|nr:hypothetical protein [Desulfobacterales bacterium]
MDSFMASALVSGGTNLAEGLTSATGREEGLACREKKTAMISYAKISIPQMRGILSLAVLEIFALSLRIS